MCKTSGEFVLYGLEQIFDLIKEKITCILKPITKSNKVFITLNQMTFSQNKLIKMLDLFHQIKTWQIPVTRYTVDVSPIEPIPSELEVQILKIKTLLETGDPAINHPNNKYLPYYKRLFANIIKQSIFKDFTYYKTGIHHFHLPSMTSKGTVRTNNLLFVKLIPLRNTAVFLKIGTHHDLDNWDSLHVLNEKHVSASERIFFDQLPIIDPDKNFSQKERKELLLSGINTFSVSKSGLPYIDGLTVVTSGDTLAAVDSLSFLKETISKLYSQKDELAPNIWERLLDDIVNRYFK